MDATMAEKSNDDYDFWAAVDQLRFELEQRARTERRASERHVFVCRHGGDVDAAKKAWRVAAERKGDAYRAYMAAFKAALESGQPMPECEAE